MNKINAETSLSVTNLDVTLGKNRILKDISLSLQKTQIGCLLGPSGCGKTTLLRSIAGFITPSAGTIYIDEKTVSNTTRVLPVEKRQVGMVFQDFALFPHLTIMQNIVFGLKNLKLSKTECQGRADELLQLIGLSDKAEVYPHELSGGQQQRVALARALAPKPKIMLLDEPFSSIDRSMRDELAYKVREILKKERATTIMVTHDQTEAYAMADKIGVIDEGALLQWDSPSNIYHQPKNKFVAQFIGENSFLDAVVLSKDTVNTAVGIIKTKKCFSDNEIGEKKQLLLRPSEVRYLNDSPIKAKVLHPFFKGGSFIHLIELENGEKLLASLDTTATLKAGDYIGINVITDGKVF